MSKKRDKRPHKSKRTRVFFHNDRQAWPNVGIFAVASQRGWLKEYRAERARWAADARERARQKAQEEDDFDALRAISARREARERVGR